TISTPFRLCAVCDAQRNGKMICCPVVENAEPHLPICQRSGEKSGQDVCLSDRARAIKQTPSGQGCAPTPRQRLTQPD
ncbi:hypothetical protein, partial [Escherichia coli]|uniref:hypothetical protein n=1 Tax=Escherichia coli TaxID=562 RepID=UPI001F5BF151